MPKAIGKYEIVPLGVDHPEYFPGFGVACTPFEGCAVGVGDNAKAAYRDAVESLAQADWDVNELPRNPAGIRVDDRVDPVTGDGQWYWYVGIRVSQRALTGIERLKVDREYWDQLARALGWVLHGWSDQHTAEFFDAERETLTLTASQRNSIMGALGKC